MLGAVLEHKFGFILADNALAFGQIHRFFESVYRCVKAFAAFFIVAVVRGGPWLGVGFAENSPHLVHGMAHTAGKGVEFVQGHEHRAVGYVHVAFGSRRHAFAFPFEHDLLRAVFAFQGAKGDAAAARRHLVAEVFNPVLQFLALKGAHEVLPVAQPEFART